MALPRRRTMKGYWVRICRACGAVDSADLPFPNQPPAATSHDRPDRPDLQRWRCHTCGSQEFRADHWEEGTPGPAGDDAI